MNKQTYLLLSVFALGALSTTLFSMVFAHGGDVEKIHACVKNSNGSIKIVGANDACGNNETALDWSIQGPPGQSGGGALVCVRCTPRDILARLNAQNFINADLDLANLATSTLPNLDFTGTSFVKTIFSNVFAEGANFTDTDFTEANMQSANVLNSNFTRAKFINADLTNADLTGSDLIDVDVTNAIWSNTSCPDGTNSNANNNTCVGHLTP